MAIWVKDYTPRKQQPVWAFTVEQHVVAMQKAGARVLSEAAAVLREEKDAIRQERGGW